MIATKSPGDIIDRGTRQVRYARYVAKGFTDDVTTCEHCGRADLKGTVRMAAVDADGGEDGETYMGVVCAAKMAGRKAGDIRTEAARADRQRDREVREAWRAWLDAMSTWTCAMRDAAVGLNAGYVVISAYYDSPGFVAARAAWRVEHPEPQRPPGY